MNLQSKKFIPESRLWSRQVFFLSTRINYHQNCETWYPYVGLLILNKHRTPLWLIRSFLCGDSIWSNAIFDKGFRLYRWVFFFSYSWAIRSAYSLLACRHQVSQVGGFFYWNYFLQVGTQRCIASSRCNFIVIDINLHCWNTKTQSVKTHFEGNGTPHESKRNPRVKSDK